MFSTGLLKYELSATRSFFDVSKDEFIGLNIGFNCLKAKKIEKIRFNAQKQLFQRFSYLNHDEDYDDLSCKCRINIILTTTQKFELSKRFYSSFGEYLKIYP